MKSSKSLESRKIIKKLAERNNINFVDEVDKADFILACTPYDNSKPIDYIPLLKSSLEKNLVFVCLHYLFRQFLVCQSAQSCLSF